MAKLIKVEQSVDKYTATSMFKDMQDYIDVTVETVKRQTAIGWA